MSSSRPHQHEGREAAGDGAFSEAICSRKKGSSGGGVGGHMELGGLPASRIDNTLPADNQHQPRRITLKSLPGAPMKRSPLYDTPERLSDRYSGGGGWGGCPSSSAARRAVDSPGAYAMSRLSLPEDISPLSDSALFPPPPPSKMAASPSSSSQKSQRASPPRSQLLSPEKRSPPRKLSDSEQAWQNKERAQSALFMQDILFSALLGEQ